MYCSAHSCANAVRLFKNQVYQRHKTPQTHSWQQASESGWRVVVTSGLYHRQSKTAEALKYISGFFSLYKCVAITCKRDQKRPRDGLSV